MGIRSKQYKQKVSCNLSPLILRLGWSNHQSHWSSCVFVPTNKCVSFGAGWLYYYNHLDCRQCGKSLCILQHLWECIFSPQQIKLDVIIYVHKDSCQIAPMIIFRFIIINIKKLLKIQYDLSKIEYWVLFFHSYKLDILSNKAFV